MSPPSPARPAAPAAKALADRTAMAAGRAVLDERRRRSWTVRDVAARARISMGTVNGVEAGRRASLDTYARLAIALGLSLEMTLGNTPGRRQRERTDVVHAAMGEIEAGLLGRHDFRVAIDHPYQHYQFAGRADLLAWRSDPPAILHLENRTRFPDIQQAAGSFNSKVQYLAPVVARQAGIEAFVSQTHVMVGLWSSEVMHTLRVRSATFQALCPDGPQRLEAWVAGVPPTGGVSRSLVLLDPFARGRQRLIVDLDAALTSARPRMRGYQEAVERLRIARRV